jgi:hypothetical protein
VDSGKPTEQPVTARLSAGKWTLNVSRKKIEEDGTDLYDNNLLKITYENSKAKATDIKIDKINGTSQDGILITSLHAGGLLRKKYEQDVIFASQKNQRKWGVLSEIHLPETFPTRFGHQEDRYLKGWILRSLGRSS